MKCSGCGRLYIGTCPTCARAARAYPNSPLAERVRLHCETWKDRCPHSPECRSEDDCTRASAAPDASQEKKA